MHLAFQYLEIRSIHFPADLWKDPQHPTINEYIAFSDNPIPLIYKDLDRLCPNSKFILTTRQLEPWLASCEWVFAKKFHDWGFTNYPVRAFHKQLFGSDRYDAKLYSDAYQRFHEDVYEYFSHRHDLLVLDLVGEKNPWEKLGGFLETKVPKIRFPHHKDYRSELINRLVNKWENLKYNRSRI